MSRKPGAIHYGFNPTATQQGLWSTDPIWQAKVSNGSLTDTNTGYHYIHTDHLGTPIVATGKDGSITWKAVTEAFGATGALPESVIQINLRFPGQYFDSETETHYNFNRDYRSNLGRYIQSDPIGLRGGQNLFAYVNGNPLSYVDPTGEIAIAPVIVWGLPIVGGIVWGLTNKKPRWPPWGGSGGDENTGGEPWPKENKEACIRTYANCVNYGWGGNCQACLDKCIASGSGDWPFHQCKPKKNGGMCESQ